MSNTKITLNRCFLLLLFLGWIFVYAAPAYAHRVTVFAWVEGDTIYTTSKFSGGRIAQKSLIEVYDSRNNLLLSGQTDAAGAFSFPVPKVDDLEIVLQAGTGHRGSWQIRKNEIEAAQKEPVDGRRQKNPPAKPMQTRTTPEKSEPHDQLNVSGNSPALTAELEKVIEETISRTLELKLHPLMVMVAELRNPEPGIKEILGGLGYIFGLIGIAAYVHSRRRKH